MNQRQSRLNRKVRGLTQCLDFKIADPSLSPLENERASAELDAISEKLYTIVPRHACSSEERLSRVMNAIPSLGRKAAALQSDAARLAALTAQIDELIPGSDISALEKLDRLAELYAEARPQLAAQAEEV